MFINNAIFVYNGSFCTSYIDKHDVRKVIRKELLLCLCVIQLFFFYLIKGVGDCFFWPNKCTRHYPCGGLFFPILPKLTYRKTILNFNLFKNKWAVDFWAY